MLPTAAGENRMDRDDLLRMLDLSGKEVTPEEAKELAILPTEEQPEKPASPTALELDEWGLRRGREILDESERAQQTRLDENAIADFHGAAFEADPQLMEDCVDPQRHEFLVQVDAVPRPGHTTESRHPHPAGQSERHRLRGLTLGPGDRLRSLAQHGRGDESVNIVVLVEQAGQVGGEPELVLQGVGEDDRLDLTEVAVDEDLSLTGDEAATHGGGARVLIQQVLLVRQVLEVETRAACAASLYQVAEARMEASSPHLVQVGCKQFLRVAVGGVVVEERVLLGQVGQVLLSRRPLLA